MSKPTAGTSTASKTQADIREVMAKIQNKAQNQRPNKPGPVNKTTPPVAVPQIRTVPIVQSATEQLQDDAFAKEIFLKHTNIADIVAEKLPERSEKTRQKYQLQLYQTYVQSPIMRISDPLHKLRFETRFWEGLFRMATTIPLREDRDYRVLKHTLNEAGIKKLCFVDMSHDNILLKNQKHVISLLQEQFSNWSGKLRKLTTYLQDYQQRSEARLEYERKKLKHQIKAHGNVAWHKIADIEDLILCELLGPSDERTHTFLWDRFAFDDDNLNKKYHVGKYYRAPVNRMPVNTMLEKIAGPELSVRTHASLSSAPAPSVSRASPFVSPKRPISRAALEKPNEVTFVPYDSSTQNQDVMGSRWRSLTKAQPVILQSATSTNPHVTADLSVAPDSIVSAIEIDHDSENIDTTNQITDQSVAKQSQIASAVGSGHTGEQEPPVKRRVSRNLQLTEVEAMDEAAADTTSSSVVATQPTMGPPANRRSPTPPQITEKEAMDVTANSSVVAMPPTTEPPVKRTFPTRLQTTNEEAMDVTANDSAASSVTCTQPGYSLDYVKCCTNIYPILMKLRLEQHPETPVTPLTMEKLVKKNYYLYQEIFARSELPPIFRKLNAQEQMALKTKGPFAWAWEELHPPIGTFPTRPQTTNKEAMDVTANDSAASSVTCAQPGYSLDYVKCCTNIYPILMKLRLEKFPKTPLTPFMMEKLVKKTYYFYQEIFARSELPQIFRKLNAQEQMALKTKGPFAWAWEQLHTPIGNERSEPPIIPKSKTPVEKATAPDVQEITAVKVRANERSRESQEQTEDRAVVQPKRQKKNFVFPGVRTTRPQNIVYESDTPPVTEPVFIGVDYEAAASQNQHTATIVDPLFEPDTTCFRPFVSSTQTQDGSSQPGQPDAPEDHVPPVSEPNKNQQNTPTVDTLSEPDSQTFRPFGSSTQNQDTNNQQEQPVPMEEEHPEALAATSTTPLAIPADDAANDPSCLIIKEERVSQQLDTSGYAGYVEEIPSSPPIYIIDDSDDDFQEEFGAPRRDTVQNRLYASFQQNTDPIEQELNSMFGPEAIDTRDGQIQSYDSTVFP